MALVSVAEAGRLVGRDRKTLYRQIEAGRLSATKNATGATVIETSELIRVFGDLSQVPQVAPHVALPQMPHGETPVAVTLVAALAEVEALKQQVAHEKSRRESAERAAGMLTARIKDKDTQIEELKEDKAELRQDREVLRKALDRAMLLIEDKTRPRHTEPAPEPVPSPKPPQPIQEQVQPEPVLQDVVFAPAPKPAKPEKKSGFWARLFRR